MSPSIGVAEPPKILVSKEPSVVSIFFLILILYSHKPLTLRTDRNVNSPYNIHKLSSEQVVSIPKLIR